MTAPTQQQREAEWVEMAARAIATANEQNGAPPFEVIVQNKHSRQFLYDQARAALAAVLPVIREADPIRIALAEWRDTRQAIFDLGEKAKIDPEQWTRLGHAEHALMDLARALAKEAGV